MRGKSPVLARLVKVSAAVLGAGLLVTGRGPVKMGAAAMVGNQRITIATLDTEVTNLSQTVKLYPGTHPAHRGPGHPGDALAGWSGSRSTSSSPGRRHHGLERAGPGALAQIYATAKA